MFCILFRCMYFCCICAFLLVLYLVCVLLSQYVNKQALYNNNLLLPLFIHLSTRYLRRSQWPRGLRRRSLAARLLRLWVRIPPGVWMFVCRECCVLSGRGLCNGLITRPEEPYRLWRVVVCAQETSKNEEAKARYRAVKIQPQWVVTPGIQTNRVSTVIQVGVVLIRNGDL